MSPTTKYNILMFLPVTLIRVPLILPLYLLIRLGELSEKVYNVVEPHLPHLKEPQKKNPESP